MTRQKTYIEKIAFLLNLPKVDVEILMTLQKRKNLLITEIAKENKRSLRHVRKRIQFLYKKGFLHRELEVLKNNRIAYRYSLISLNKMTARVRKDILAQLDEIENIIKKIKQV